MATDFNIQIEQAKRRQNADRLGASINAMLTSLRVTGGIPMYEQIAYQEAMTPVLEAARG